MNNKLKEDLDQAVSIINNLIDGLSFMPVCWDEMIGIEISEQVKEFMHEQDPGRWGSQAD